MNEKKSCKYCGGDIAIRNPTGKCDHLYYPENVNKSFQMVNEKGEPEGYFCQCCNVEISLAQARFSTLCGLCDTGLCQQPKAYHALQKRVEELEKANEVNFNCFMENAKFKARELSVDKIADNLCLDLGLKYIFEQTYEEVKP